MAHITKGGNPSNAWKNLERAWAKCLQDAGFKKAKRKSRAHNIGQSDDDVSLPEIPTLKSDCKYRVGGWSFHTIFKECEDKYVVDKDDFLVMPTKSGGEQGFLVTLRAEAFSKILAKAYLGNKRDSSVLLCPACSTETRGQQATLGLVQHKCPDCSFEFLAKQSENINGKTKK